MTFERTGLGEEVTEKEKGAYRFGLALSGSLHDAVCSLTQSSFLEARTNSGRLIAVGYAVFSMSHGSHCIFGNMRSTDIWSQTLNLSVRVRSSSQGKGIDYYIFIFVTE